MNHLLLQELDILPWPYKNLAPQIAQGLHQLALEGRIQPGQLISSIPPAYQRECVAPDLFKHVYERAKVRAQRGVHNQTVVDVLVEPARLLLADHDADSDGGGQDSGGGKGGGLGGGNEASSSSSSSSTALDALLARLPKASVLKMPSDKGNVGLGTLVRVTGFTLPASSPPKCLGEPGQQQQQQDRGKGGGLKYVYVPLKAEAQDPAQPAETLAYLKLDVKTEYPLSVSMVTNKAQMVTPATQQRLDKHAPLVVLLAYAVKVQQQQQQQQPPRCLLTAAPTTSRRHGHLLSALNLIAAKILMESKKKGERNMPRRACRMPETPQIEQCAHEHWRVQENIAGKVMFVYEGPVPRSSSSSSSSIAGSQTRLVFPDMSVALRFAESGHMPAPDSDKQRRLQSQVCTEDANGV